MKREVFRILFLLCGKHPWLEQKVSQLEKLLFEECETEEEKQLIINLINNFEYVSEERFKRLINDLVKEIVDNMSLRDFETQLVAMAADRAPDSSQYLLYALKIALSTANWKHHKMINQFGKAYSTYKENNSLKNIILIDEFLGSGQTAINRVNSLHSVFRENGIEDYKIYLRVLVSTEFGLKKLREQNVDAKSLILLPKGISDNFDGNDLEKAIKIMEGLEEKLAKIVENEHLPNFGYGRAEALYFNQGGNPPNNVFPIFWWPKLENGEDREPILQRAK